MGRTIRRRRGEVMMAAGVVLGVVAGGPLSWGLGCVAAALLVGSGYGLRVAGDEGL